MIKNVYRYVHTVVTSIARLDFDILKSVEHLEEYKNDGKEGQAGVM